MASADLKKIALLRNLPPKQLKRIAAIAREEEFPAGAMIIKKSEPAEDLFLVISGRIKIFCYSSSRKRKTFAYLGPGDFFGELAVIADVGRSAWAEAVAACRLITIHKKDLRRLLLSDTKFCFNMLQAVAERLRHADEEIENLLFRNVLGRVSKTLHNLALSCGETYKEGLLLTERYTHQELADLVGTTREPLSRALSMLKRADLVESVKGHIYIRKPGKLEELISTSVETR
ncbi:MAG: Crp/Fnr family transcriptional regulator [Elusimicrobiota bacterium]